MVAMELKVPYVGAFGRLMRRTGAAAWADRVPGLAAEAAFWSALSLAPLVLTIVGLLGYLTPLIGEAALGRVEQHIVSAASRVLTPEAMHSGLQPLLTQLLHHGHRGVATLGFLLALWSGSTATNSYVNAIIIAYGLRDVRSVVRGRLVSFVIYLGGLAAGTVLLPILILGPAWTRGILPSHADGLVTIAYWPVLFVVFGVLLTAGYHVAAPAPRRWRHDLPGTALAVLVWLLGSALLRLYVTFSFAHNPVYAGVTAPIAVLLFLYVTALAVLVGAELNVTIDTRRPDSDR